MAWLRLSSGSYLLTGGTPAAGGRGGRLAPGVPVTRGRDNGMKAHPLSG
ncbi:hypothetical protein PV779_12920 [Streptomyces sp. ID01-9D]|nr:hypothetical protein [Streptomyces sp. ID01-9D]